MPQSTTAERTATVPSGVSGTELNDADTSANSRWAKGVVSDPLRGRPRPVPSGHGE
jgi:hypothetical protein